MQGIRAWLDTVLKDAKGAPQYKTGDRDPIVHPFDYLEQLLGWGARLAAGASLPGCISRETDRQPASIDLAMVHAAGCFPHTWQAPLSLEGVEAANMQTAAAAAADPEAMLQDALERAGQVSRLVRPAAEPPLRAPSPGPRPLAQPPPPPPLPQPRRQAQAPMDADGTHRVDAAAWRQNSDGWWHRGLTRTGITRRLAIQGAYTALQHPALRCCACCAVLISPWCELGIRK